MINKSKVFKVFSEHGLAVLEEYNPEGYRVMGDDGVKSERKSLKVLEREARRMSKKGTGYLRLKTLHRL
jgi:hypothetical protein|tara:strand:- start:1899 stop:2105 length:207 start_codon:yes stop_codon:yes gene_type:complete